MCNYCLDEIGCLVGRGGGAGDLHSKSNFTFLLQMKFRRSGCNSHTVDWLSDPQIFINFYRKDYHQAFPVQGCLPFALKLVMQTTFLLDFHKMIMLIRS